MRVGPSVTAVNRYFAGLVNGNAHLVTREAALTTFAKSSRQKIEIVTR
jgi:hypothetical protein